MTGSATTRFWELRWNEVAALDRDKTLIILPTGAIEQPGHHLPLETDIFNSSQIALRAAEKAQALGVGSVMLAPPIWWGTSPHHLAYPGTVSLRMETMSALLVDIAASFARHGFYRMLWLNGHGGNGGVLNATALRVSEEVGISPAVVSYWSLIRDALRDIGESANGGMGHACEMETSMQLYLREELVAMNTAALDMPRELTSYSCVDFRNPGPVMMPWDFMRDSKTGAMGDPTRANTDKGRRIVEAAVNEVVELSRQLLALPAADLHTGEVGARLLAREAQRVSATAT
jgi:creatinine amidohydrolase